MRAIMFDGAVRLVEAPLPKRGPHEALIRVRLAGVCNTDLEIIKGYMGFTGILGHEFVGIVEEAETPSLVGQRVVGEINCACHVCKYCLMEMPHHCLNRTVLGILNRNGAFAEYLTLPEANLHVVPEPVRDEVAVFTEPAAAAYRILEQVEIDPDDRVVVLGDGKLSQLVCQVLAQHSQRVVCIGKHSWKMDHLDRMGIRTVRFDAFDETGADIVVEATGSAEGFQRALEIVRPEGVVILKTTVAGMSPAHMAFPVIHEVKILGSRCGPFRPALDALAAGAIKVDPLISEVFSLANGAEALERAAGLNVLKILLRT